MAVVRANAGIENIKPHMVGGPAVPAPTPSIVLNSNESVFGPGPNTRAAARAAISSIENYLEFPDHLLTPAIATCFGLDQHRITVGVGSDDLLARLARAYLGPETDLIRSANWYLKVPNYAYANGASVVSVPDDKFKPSVERMIGALSARTRLVYLANPEIPAGTYLSGQEVRALHAAMPDNALLVIDSAYEDYVDAPDYEPAHTNFVFQANQQGRRWLTNALEDLGLVVIPSQANFILVHFPDPEKPASAADAYLRQRGVAVRRFASPAYDAFVRITLGYMRDLKITRDCMAEFLSGLG